MANTIFTQNSSPTFRKPHISKVGHHRKTHYLRINSRIKYNRFSVPAQNPGLRFQNDTTRNIRNMAVHASTQPGPPPPSDPSSPDQWKFWIVGTIFTILMSFTRSKWGPLLQLKEKVETTIEEAEKVTEIVKEVVEGAEKFAEEAVKHLPEGKLHDAIESAEKVLEDIDQKAQKTENFLEQVEEEEKEFVSFVESTIHEEKNVVTTTESKDQK